MNDVLIYNFVLDLKKEKVDSFERAMLIEHFRKSNKLSIRQLADKLMIPNSTLQDWLLWNRLTKKQYTEYRRLGYTDSDIYRYLRDNKLESKKKLESQDPLKTHIEKTTEYLNRNRGRAGSQHHKALIALQNACNYALMYAEKK